MGVLSGCKPRKEVLKGDLDDAIFAADFGDLIGDKAPAVYGDAATFFQNTHPAKQLCKVVQAVFARLADSKEGGATIRLSTGFGGGKTHTLMALWHLGENIADLSLGTELLPAAGRPKNVHVAAVDAGKAGVPEFTAHGKLKIHSLWGELFYALGGEPAVKALGKADDPEASPSDSQIESAFPKGPVLILLDELVIYMAKLSERGQGNLLGFINSLAAAVSKRPQTVLIITDPGGQAAYASQSAKLGASLQAAASKLDDVAGRKFTDFDPIGDESAKVIVRRLLEKVNTTAAQSASASYHSLFERVLKDSPGTVPVESGTIDYAKRVVDCYPFHPRLLLTAQDRFQGLQSFQKSRGVLRLFARILRDVWDHKTDVELISAGEIDWGSDGIQGDLLSRLDRSEFKAAISADVVKHAGELDGGKPGIHRRVASAILLESIPLQANSGLEPADLALAVLRPDEAGPEPVEAMDRLMGVCWHTYPTSTGKGCQFRFEPNVLKQIEQRKSHIPLEDAKSRVLAEAQGYFAGMTFKVSNWPTSAKQVSESATLQLALCESEKIARAVCAYQDDSDPTAPMPRSFQNAILAVTASPTAFDAAVDKSQRMLAAAEIERDNRGDSGKLVRDQLKKITPELHRQFAIQTRRAFDVIVLPGGVIGHIDEQYQVPDDQILQKAHGQSSLKKFLDAKDLIYQPGACLDSHLFMKDVLPGATPLADKPGVYTAKAVHERFLSAPKLRLIPDSSIVRATILKAVDDGKIAVRLADGRAYDSQGCIEGPDGKRRRSPDTLSGLTLEDNVLITPIDSPAAAEWLKEDKPTGTGGTGGGTGGGGGGFPPPPTPQGKVTATSWEKVLEFSDERSLLELHLISTTPTDTAVVQQAVQPLGAVELTVSVSVGGAVKDGGMMNFAATDIKPTHPAKPLQIAQTVFNSAQGTAQFETDLKLTFGATGRAGMRSALEQVHDKLPDGVSVRGTFDKKPGG